MELTVAVPESAVFLSATVLEDSDVEIMVDLLYSALEDGYFHGDRMECIFALGSGHENLPALQHLLTLNKTRIPYDVDANVFEGKSRIGVVVFYMREEEDDSVS